MTEPLIPDSYRQFLADLKGRIRAAQLRASMAVNRELVLLYWQIGRDILDRQERENWGAKAIDRLAGDLKQAFADMKGFSPRNLKYMRASAETCPMKQLCKRCLHKSPGITTSRSWKNLRRLRTASGTPKRPFSTAGAAMCWFCRLNPGG